jgi:hypothetical protein
MASMGSKTDGIDIVVRCHDSQRLDETIQQLPGCAAAVVAGSWNGDTCIVRVFSGLGFLKFALPRQGYGEIISERKVT